MKVGGALDLYKRNTSNAIVLSVFGSFSITGCNLYTDSVVNIYIKIFSGPVPFDIFVNYVLLIMLLSSVNYKNMTCISVTNGNHVLSISSPQPP